MAQLKSLTVNGASSFIGSVFAPTAPAGTNNTQVSTTAFVTAAVQAAIQAVSGK